MSRHPCDEPRKTCKDRCCIANVGHGSGEGNYCGAYDHATKRCTVQETKPEVCKRYLCSEVIAVLVEWYKQCTCYKEISNESANNDTAEQGGPYDSDVNDCVS